jgi:hypothetical protein
MSFPSVVEVCIIHILRYVEDFECIPRIYVFCTYQRRLSLFSQQIYVAHLKTDVAQVEVWCDVDLELTHQSQPQGRCGNEFPILGSHACFYFLRLSKNANKRTQPADEKKAKTKERCDQTTRDARHFLQR